MPRLHRSFSLLPVLLCGVFLAGCFGSGEEEPEVPTGEPSWGQCPTGTITVEFPDGDPSVSYADGGPGFTGEDGWQTGGAKPLGDPRAVKGGTMLSSVPNWPENLRMYGTGANTFLNSIIESLCFETALQLDPNTLEFVPGLCSHWKISEDQLTFTFRIDPRAHWADGKPVTSEDFVATWRLGSDPKTVDPMFRSGYTEKMEEPKPLSKYVFEVKCKERHWRNFISFGAMRVLPAHEIGTLSGAEYLEKYNFALPVGSGPYKLCKSDVKDNESLTLTRRPDYWGGKLPMNEGLYNFDKIRFVVIRDQRQSFEKAIKGDLDFYPVYTASWWVEDLEGVEAIDKGWLVKQKVYTKIPQGIQGLAFNLKKPPFDDVRVRKAIAHLYARKTMVDKFAYGEYDLLKSYFPGGDAENSSNVLVEYDPREAVRLLEEAGWTEIGPDGIRRKNGQRLAVNITYRTQGFGKYYTTLKEDAKKAGVEVNLNLLTPETHWKNMQEKNFEVTSAGWTQSQFPSPKQNYHSTMADEEGSNNVAGLRNPEADAIIEQYDEEFDAAKRIELLRELDAVIFEQHSYVLEWYLPCERLLYWNKFGTPETVFPKYGDYREAYTTWWVDPSKEAALKAAKKSGDAIKQIPPAELRPWDGEQPATASTN